MSARVVVIGIGNPYRCDDGVGPAVTDLLAATGPTDITCTVSTGEPADLLAAWDGADTAIIIDALHHPHAEPGRIHHLVAGDAEDLAPAAAASTHGIGLGQTLALARALDRIPAHLIVYAIEVTEVGYGAGLSAPVAEAAAQVAEKIRQTMAAGWG
jgi:hydrogenase maturation protease